MMMLRAPFKEIQHSLRRTVDPVSVPVSLIEAKRALDLGEEEDTELDAEIEDLILDAVEYVEERANRAICLQTWELTMDRFPRLIELWRPPVIAVSSIKYFDPAGAEQTVDSADYEVDTKSAPGRIRPVQDTFWPETEIRLNAVTVLFTAGYESSIPRVARLAVLFALRALYTGCSPDESDAFISQINRFGWSPE